MILEKVIYKAFSRIEKTNKKCLVMLFQILMYLEWSTKFRSAKFREIPEIFCCKTRGFVNIPCRKIS
jgi:hypothetical protein